MKKLLIIGDRLDFSNSNITLKDLENSQDKILETAKKQIDIGCAYLNIRVGSTDEDEAKLKWLVKLIQSKYNNFPLFLDSKNRKVLEGGLEVYNSEKNKAFINSADFGDRQDFFDLAADMNSGVVCVCMKNMIPMDGEERLNLCTRMLEKGMSIGLTPPDMYFDPVSVSVVEDQDGVINVLETIKQINDLGLNTIVGVSHVSAGMKRDIKAFIQSSFLSMSMLNGLKAAILNPFTTLLMANVVASENLLNQRLFSQAEFTSFIDRYKNEVIEEHKKNLDESSINSVQTD